MTCPPRRKRAQRQPTAEEVADAQALDTYLAAHRRLKPPPTRFEVARTTPGALALARDRKLGVA